MRLRARPDADCGSGARARAGDGGCAGADRRRPGRSPPGWATSTSSDWRTPSCCSARGRSSRGVLGRGTVAMRELPPARRAPRSRSGPVRRLLYGPEGRSVVGVDGRGAGRPGARRRARSRPPRRARCSRASATRWRRRSSAPRRWATTRRSASGWPRAADEPAGIQLRLCGAPKFIRHIHAMEKRLERGFGDAGRGDRGARDRRARDRRRRRRRRAICRRARSCGCSRAAASCARSPGAERVHRAITTTAPPVGQHPGSRTDSCFRRVETT